MQESSTPRTAVALNAVLRRLGLQLVRTSTLEQLQTRQADSARLAELERALGSIEARLGPLEAKLGPLAAKLEPLESRLAPLEERARQDALGDLIRYAMKAHWHGIDRIEDAAPPAPPSRCPLCGHEPGGAGFAPKVSACIFQGGRLVRHQCPQCDAIFGPQKMFALDDELLDLEYRNLYRVYSESDSTASSLRAFGLLQPRRDGQYLDFGCGGPWTAALQTARDQGWRLHGFEPSAAQGSDLVYTRWSDIEPMQFDGIYSHNVLEHLFDPVATNMRLARLLKPGGRIVHVTPCFEYLYEYTRFHVFFLPGRAAEVMAARSGLRIVERVRDGEFMACVLEPV